MAERLRGFGQVLPTSSGDLALLHGALTQLQTESGTDLERLSGEHEERAGERAGLAKSITDLTAERDRVRNQVGNIPPDADQRRGLIARGAGIPVERLRYIGELLDIPPEHRGWERAILTIIRPLASDLLVAPEDFPTVRAWTDRHDVGGDITLVPGVTHRPVRHHPAGTVPAMVEVSEGPYQGWLSEELERFTYLCVEKDTELDGPRPGGVIGRVTRAGMRTAPNGRVIKADATRRYRWVGRDNSALRAQIADELEGLKAQFDAAAQQLETARLAVRRQQTRVEELKRLVADLDWVELDPAPAERKLATLMAALETADTPEAARRRAAYAAAQTALLKAQKQTGAAEDEVARLDQRRAVVVRIRERAADLVRAHEPLTQDEVAAGASLPFRAPVPEALDPLRCDVEQTAEAAVGSGYADAAALLNEQIQQHDVARQLSENLLITTIRAYRNLNDRTQREIDDTIDALPALEQIHRQLVTDDLPRARTAWLTKVDADLNQGLRTLLKQIDTDRRAISRGLDPINAVLSGVPFRNGSHLTVEPVERVTSNFHEFSQAVLSFTRDNPLGEDLFTDETKIEASFKRLRRKLEQLTDPSRAGESWRRSVFDAREQVRFRALETPPSGRPIVHEGVSGMSGGEGQELIAFILGAALRYRLGEGGQAPPTYGSVLLDEGFVKADSDYTGRALGALQELGFQLIIGAPREKATAFEDHVDLVAYINTDPDRPESVRIYSMTIQEALELDEGAA
jgi:uncharacterized protein YPO0396